MDHHWINKTAKLIEHAGRDSLWPHLTEFLAEQLDFQQILILLETNSAPQLLFEQSSSELFPANITQDYLDRAYLLDPFYLAPFDAQSQSDIFHLIDVTPDGFYLSEYYQSYYADSGLLDDLQYWYQVGDNLRITINLARSKESRFFSTQEVQQLKRFLPIVDAVMAAFWAARNIDYGQSSTGINMRERLERARENFGSSVLTEREQEVIRSMLAGYSTKVAAQKLDISPETVHMHRKNIYSKLDISSQAEVFTLFLDSVAEHQGSLESDPLLAHH